MRTDDMSKSSMITQLLNTLNLKQLMCCPFIIPRLLGHVLIGFYWQVNLLLLTLPYFCKHLEKLI